MNVHSSIIQDSQKTEATQLPINWLMDRQNVIDISTLYIKRNEILIHAAAYLDLKIKMLSVFTFVQYAKFTL